MRSIDSQALPTFTAVDYPKNLTDGLFFGALGVGWSKGSSLITELPSIPVIAPGPHAVWKIQALSFRAQLLMLNEVAGFGRWGRITAGLTTQPATISLTGINDPLDSTLTMTLWDPATDPLPPEVTSLPTSAPTLYLPVSASLQLPQPIVVKPGITPPNVGLWMAPSRIGQQGSGGIVMAIYNARYSLVYDDESLGA